MNHKVRRVLGNGARRFLFPAFNYVMLRILSISVKEEWEKLSIRKEWGLDRFSAT